MPDSSRRARYVMWVFLKFRACELSAKSQLSLPAVVKNWSLRTFSTYCTAILSPKLVPVEPVCSLRIASGQSKDIQINIARIANAVQCHS